MDRPCCTVGIKPWKTWINRPFSQYRRLAGWLDGGILSDVAIDRWGDEPPTILYICFDLLVDPGMDSEAPSKYSFPFSLSPYHQLELLDD